ncbi:hypothetical protein ABK040_002550 [Willaertia magna]
MSSPKTVITTSKIQSFYNVILFLLLLLTSEYLFQYLQMTLSKELLNNNNNFKTNNNVKINNNKINKLTIAILTAPRYKSKNQELVETFFSLINEIKDKFILQKEQFKINIYLLNHHGEKHVNLFELFYEIYKKRNWNLTKTLQNEGMFINNNLENDNEDYSFEEDEDVMMDRDLFITKLRERIKLPSNELLDHVPILFDNKEENINTLTFSYKEIYNPLENSPVIHRQLIHTITLLENLMNQTSFSSSNDNFTNNINNTKEEQDEFIFLLEDDFPICKDHFQKFLTSIQLGKGLFGESFCSSFFATGGSAILFKKELIPILLKTLRVEPTIKNKRLLWNDFYQGYRPIAHDVLIQRCLLGELEECREIIEKKERNGMGCLPMLVSDTLYFHHVGYDSTDQFLKHDREKWLCSYRNPLTSHYLLPTILRLSP